MMQKIQRFGGAMFTPVMLFSFAGITVGLATLFTNGQIFGSLADPDGIWYKVWTMISEGGWTVFRNMALVFVAGLPIGLAKKQNARACLEAIVTYLTFNYFVCSILTQWGSTFGVDFTQEAVSGSGLTTIAGIKTLDTGIIGGILIAAIVVYIHNRFFDTQLPEFLGIFKGSSFVYVISFFVMIPVAFLVVLIWPHVQNAMGYLQGFLLNSGAAGVGIYAFLNRILIPTGLHHFVYSPFLYDNVAVDGGIVTYWMNHLSEFAQSTKSLKELFPQGGFALYSMEKMFGSLGIGAAFIATAKPEKKKMVIGLVIPIVTTAIIAGVTEPLEFTFLFLCPPLFLVHSVLSGLLDMTCYIAGVSGYMSGGLIEAMAMNWIPLWANHWMTYVVQIIIGFIFSGIYFAIFRFAIMKFNIKTPGREEDDKEVKFYSKAEYKDKKNAGKGGSVNAEKAAAFLDLLGGAANIDSVTNCATRLRVTIKDPSLVQDTSAFKASGAHGLVNKGKAIQVIVGMDVPMVREEFETLLTQDGEQIASMVEQLGCPVDGTVMMLNQMKDDAFASGSMGEGVAVVPEGTEVCAPADGTVTMLFDTLHAIGMTTSEGVEVLIHIGIDTVNLKGEGFHAHVANGDQVKAGQKLITFDPEVLQAHQLDSTIAVLITNSEDYQTILPITGDAKQGDPCLEIK